MATTTTSSNNKQEVDVVIVGGGPCGLALCKGLLDLKFSCLVIEKDVNTIMTNNKNKNDWSKAYSYRLDVRGVSVMKRIGAMEALCERSVPKQGFSGTTWLPDGSFKKVGRRTKGSVGYWLQRPHLVGLLADRSLLPENVRVQGKVEQISFGGNDATASIATVHVCSVGGDAAAPSRSMTIQAKYVFGCDGIKSIVRSTLQEMDESFQIHKVASPSAGLCFRATLIRPPADFNPQEAYTIVSTGKNKNPIIRLSLLPFNGKAGEMRPMACARQPDDVMFQPKTAQELYSLLDQEFPQLKVRESSDSILPMESAEAWCSSEGSTFPVPRYAGKAIKIVKQGIVVGILGDALHSFPPDLGLGVNSGMVDVETVLDFMRDNAVPSSSTSANVSSSSSTSTTTPFFQKQVELLNETLVAEAKCICQMIPRGMPYQYTLPHSLSKVLFFTGFLARFKLYSWFQYLSDATKGCLVNPLHPPVVIMIQQDDPAPLKFTEIMRRHTHNTVVLWSMIATASAAILSTALGGCWGNTRPFFCFK